MDEENKITYFGQTDSRSKRVNFGIKSKDRTKHVYVIGKTGMGKSTLLENMAVQDIQNGNGFAFIDPHGKSADLLLEYIPEDRINDVLYFAPFDTEYPIAFNIMEDVGEDKRHLVVAGLMSAFKKLFGEESFSDRMQYILQNTILALLEYPGATMLGVNRMLTDKAYRKKVVENVTNTSVKAYWNQEFATYTERFAAEATPAIQNKIGQFTANPLIRNLIGQEKSSFNLREIMDERKIIIVNLSKGRVGEGNANLIGSMLITKIYLAAMSRADTSEKELYKLPNFYLFVDEFQSFANKSFADILSEARKYKLNLTIAHQYIEQMEEEVRAAVFGNVGTTITFRVGAYDAEVLEKEFAPQFTAEDLVNLGIFQIYLKLMIDGVGSVPFSAVTLPPIKKPDISFKNEVIASSRRQFAKPRAEVEEVIRKWHEPMVPVPVSQQQKTGSTLSAGGNGVKPSAKPYVKTAPNFSQQGPSPRTELRQEHRPEVKKYDKPKPQVSLADDPAIKKFKDDLKQIKEKIIRGEQVEGVISEDQGPSEKTVKEERKYIKEERDERKPIPLSELSNKPKIQANIPRSQPASIKKVDGKGPSAENLKGLRDALASVMKGGDEIKKTVPMQPHSNVTPPKFVERKVKESEYKEKVATKTENVDKKIVSSEVKVQAEKQKMSPKGIPDDELRKMLDVGD